MTVHDIITDYLRRHGYDGLVDEECGCWLEDLCPCGCDSLLCCQPGYTHVITEGDPEAEEYEVGTRVMRPGRKEEQEKQA